MGFIRHSLSTAVGSPVRPKDEAWGASHRRKRCGIERKKPCAKKALLAHKNEKEKTKRRKEDE